MNNTLKNINDFVKTITFILNSQQKRLGLIVLLITLFNSFLQMIGVAVIVPLITAMTDPNVFMQKWYVILLKNISVINNYTGAFVFICLFSVFVYAFKDAVSIFQVWVSNKYAFKIQRELSVTVLTGYMNRVYDFLINYGTAKILRDTQTDTGAFNNIITAVFTIITEVFAALFILGFIILQDFKMGICILVLGCVCLLIIYKVFKPKMRRAGEKYHNAAAEIQKVLLQSVEGIKEVQVMKKQTFFMKKYADSYIYQQKPQIVIGVGANIPTYIIETVFFSGLMLFICIRSIIDSSYVNNIAIMASYVMGAIRIMPSLGRISIQLNRIIFNKASLINLSNVMENFRDYERRVSIEKRVDSGNNISFKTQLKLEHIFWHYSDTDKNVLSDLSLLIKKGQAVGIIGASGVGKSTLADIILGLHQPQQGNIVLDDVDIKNIPFEYSRVIGYVPQNVYLVDGTVRENVAFGVEEDCVNDEMVWNALDQAQLKDFVNSLEKKLDTVVGERGVKFSGGQRQRIAIARALYRKPQILILDEATSALDNETERAVIESIEKLYGAITMIIIAHRLTTVKMCDIVYEIANGKAKERSKKEVFG